mgnify:CR=1 FL=1
MEKKIGKIEIEILSDDIEGDLGHLLIEANKGFGLRYTLEEIDFTTMTSVISFYGKKENLRGFFNFYAEENLFENIDTEVEFEKLFEVEMEEQG